eukprot:Rhum_TRINITY_DN11071_c0_g1::Rhum_TRINITY_DN11071_c0_g1_i1::g.42198::m.42198
MLGLRWLFCCLVGFASSPSSSSTTTPSRKLLRHVRSHARLRIPHVGGGTIPTSRREGRNRKRGWRHRLRRLAHPTSSSRSRLVRAHRDAPLRVLVAAEPEPLPVVHKQPRRRHRGLELGCPFLARQQHGASRAPRAEGTLDADAQGRVERRVLLLRAPHAAERQVREHDVDTAAAQRQPPPRRSVAPRQLQAQRGARAALPLPRALRQPFVVLDRARKLLLREVQPQVHAGREVPLRLEQQAALSDARVHHHVALADAGEGGDAPRHRVVQPLVAQQPVAGRASPTQQRHAPRQPVVGSVEEAQQVRRRAGGRAVLRAQRPQRLVAEEPPPRRLLQRPRRRLPGHALLRQTLLRVERPRGGGAPVQRLPRGQGGAEAGGCGEALDAGAEGHGGACFLRFLRRLRFFLPFVALGQRLPHALTVCAAHGDRRTLHAAHARDQAERACRTVAAAVTVAVAGSSRQTNGHLCVVVAGLHAVLRHRHVVQLAADLPELPLRLRAEHKLQHCSAAHLLHQINHDQTPPCLGEPSPRQNGRGVCGGMGVG